MDIAELVGELLAGAGQRDPYPIYEQLRPHGPLARVHERFFVATGYDTIEEILRDPRMRVGDQELAAFYGSTGVDPDDEALGPSLLRANPPDHTRMRRLVSGAFTPRRLAVMRDAVAAQADNLGNYLRELGRGGAPVDFISEFAYPLPIRVICSLLGVPVGDSGWFREQAAALTVALEPALLADDLSDAAAARGRLQLYFRDLIARRRVEPREDLTTALVQAHDADGSVLSEPELLATLILLLVAGFETTTNLLGNGLVTLLERPDRAAQLRADPDLVGRFVEEMLRFDSPVQLTSRYCRVDTSYSGVSMPAFSQVLVLLGAGNRDPGRFAEPATFNPGREQNQPLSFGGGAHYCLGAALARMEAQLAFTMLLERFPTLAAAGKPVRRNRLVLRGYAEIPIALGDA